MSMSPERSRQLHNFSLPPVLKWGSQRLLRCSLDNRSQSSILHHRSPPAQPIGTTTSKFRFAGDDDDCNGIKAVREKLILDLRADANNMMQLSSMLTEEERVAAIQEDDSASVRPPPWNLRTRRAAACKAAAAQPPPPVQSIANARPSGGGGGGRFRGGFGVAGNHIHGVEKKKEKEKEKEKTKFSVSLAKDEIEDDFYAMVGMRPRRRPRKRAKVVQNYMNSMFPGLWLTEVTPESYKVPEIPES